MSTPAPVQEASTSKLEMIVHRDELLRELAFTHGLTESKTTVPILSSVLFEGEGTMLTIKATDLERSGVTTVQAKVKKPGSVAVPARKLYDYVKLLPSGEITLKELDNSWISLRSGRSNTKMVAMPRTNFPKVETIDSVGKTPISLPSASLKMLITQTAFAVSKEESRYTLNGALFGMEPNKLFMVATDGHRLALSEKEERVEGVSAKTTVLIPIRALSDLMTLLSESDSENIGMVQTESSILFSVGHRKYAVRRLSGQFPNYEAVLPRDNDKVVIVGSADMERALRRVSTFADERSSAVKITLDSNSLKISASSTANGESEDSIDTPYDKESIVTGFNATYLLDFIKAIGGKGEFKMMFKNSSTAALLRPDAENQQTDFQCVLMPLRVA